MIRWKVFLSALALLILIAWIVIYKLDYWVKRGIENGISAITETKTDISNLNISFKDSKLTIRRLQIASRTDAFQNLLELEDIVVDFQFLPLLRRRVVVDEFSVTGIQWGTRRATSGFLPRKKKQEPSWFSEVASQAFESFKKEASATPVSRLLDFQIPSSPKEVLEGLNLKSLDAYKAVVLQTQNLQSTWSEQIREMGDFRQYKDWAREIQRLTQNVPQSPVEILKRVNELQKLVTKINEEKNRIEKITADFQRDFDSATKLVQTATNAVGEDFDRAKALVGLDVLNLENLSRLLFGDQWLSHAEEVLRFQSRLRALIGTVKPNEGVQVRERAKGRDIIFITPRKQPAFVLSKSDFSVKGLEGGDRNRVSQLYEVNLRGVNSSPKLYGKPTTVNISGKFTDSILAAANIDAFWDYTTNTPKDRYRAEVSRLLASHWPMGIPEFFPLKLGKGYADVQANLEFVGDDFKWTTRVNFSSVAWDFSDIPKQGMIVRVLTNVIERVKGFFVEFELFSTKTGLDFNVRSDLDSVLKAGIESAIRAKWEEFQKTLKAEVEHRVLTAKESALNGLQSFEKQVRGKLNSALSEVDQVGDEARKAIGNLEKKAQNSAGKTIEDKVGNPLKKLKKLF